MCKVDERGVGQVMTWRDNSVKVSMTVSVCSLSNQYTIDLGPQGGVSPIHCLLGCKLTYTAYAGSTILAFRVVILSSSWIIMPRSS